MTTLGEYLNWIRAIGGSYRSGIAADHQIGMVPIFKIIAPDGQHYIYPGTDLNEVLMPEIIKQMDRRLGVAYPG